MMDFENTSKLDPIYSKDTKDNIRVWFAEIGWNDENSAGYRVHSGIHEGKIVVSSWRKCEPKNLGKSNATTAHTQAEKEAKAAMQDKLSKGYTYDLASTESHNKPFKPMLAKEYKHVDFDTNLWFVQPKLDGIRCIAKYDGLWTRSGKKIESCPHIERALEPLFRQSKELIIDGELYNHVLRDNFNEITSIVRKTNLSDEDLEKSQGVIQYHAYDVIYKGKDTFFERSEFLHQLVQLVQHPCIKYVDTISIFNEMECDELYASFIEDGFEGMMIRNNDPYENKRSSNLLKRKDFLTDEFEVVTIHEGIGNWQGYAKQFVCSLPDEEKTLFGAGVRGNQKVLKELWESKMPDWATVRYFTPTPDGKPRFAVVVDWGYGERND